MQHFNIKALNKYMQKKGIKLDLALMDDIKKFIGNYKTLDDNIKKQKSKTVTSLIAYQDSVRASLQNAQNAVDLISQLDAKSKELGLPDSGMGGYKKDLSTKAAEYKTKFSQIDNLIKTL